MEGVEGMESSERQEKFELKDTSGDKTDGSQDVRIAVDDPSGKPEEQIVQKDFGDTALIDNKEEGKVSYTKNKTKEQEAEDDEKKDVEKPLIDEKETVAIDLGEEYEKHPGADTPTLPLPEKKKPPEEEKEEPPSMFLHPIDTMRYAWTKSKSVPEFFLRAICIMFGSIGWVICIGGVPFLPLVMLIIGSIFIHDCPVQPNIPVYLVVAGLFGLIQHAATVVTKYIPKEKRGPLQDQHKKCLCLDGILETFLFIWFIAGCVWVYSIYEPEYEDKSNKDYCHKTVYLFTFWMFNLTFIILCFIIVFAFCVILCIVTTAK